MQTCEGERTSAMISSSQNKSDYTCTCESALNEVTPQTVIFQATTTAVLAVPVEKIDCTFPLSPNQPLDSTSSPLSSWRATPAECCWRCSQRGRGRTSGREGLLRRKWKLQPTVSWIWGIISLRQWGVHRHLDPTSTTADFPKG